MNEELNNLTEEEKQKIVDDVNNNEEVEFEEGNTSTFTLDQIGEGESMGSSAQEQYQKAIGANVRALSILDSILSQKKISSKNMRKLVFATLKLPEEGATLKFGGTEEQKQVCEFAYAQMQLAANTRAFIMGVNAMKEARKAEQLKEQSPAEEAKGEQNE